MIRSLGFLTMLCAGGAKAAVQAHAFWPSTKLLWVKRDRTLGELTQAAWYASFHGSFRPCNC